MTSLDHDPSVRPALRSFPASQGRRSGGVTLRGSAMVPAALTMPLGDYNEPYPDLAVLADLPFDTLGRPPEPHEIFAMIEVADSSLRNDSKTKRSLYARFEIADYLIVDIAGDALIHLSQPNDRDYGRARRLGRGDVFTLTALPKIELRADPFLRPS